MNERQKNYKFMQISKLRKETYAKFYVHILQV